MQKHLVLSAVFVSALLVSVRAGDFWKEKDFQEWSQKEIARMLNKSPWSHRMDIPLRFGRSGRSGRGGGGQIGRGGGTGPGGPGGGGIPGGSGGDVGPGGPGGGGGPGGLGGPSGGRSQPRRVGGRGFVPTLDLTIRWYSARPIKEAFVRTYAGEDVDGFGQATHMLEQEETHYVIGILGFPSWMFKAQTGRLPEIAETLKTQSFLKVKRKEPIAVQEVRIQTGEGIAEIFLRFPRKSADGPLIELKDGKVELVTQVGQLEVKRKFKLKKMVYKGKLEL